MTLAYILINTDYKAESDVIQALKKIPGIKEAYKINGLYDIIAKIEKECVEELKTMITSTIWNLDKIKSSETMICAHA